MMLISKWSNSSTTSGVPRCNWKNQPRRYWSSLTKRAAITIQRKCLKNQATRLLSISLSYHLRRNRLSFRKKPLKSYWNSIKSSQLWKKKRSKKNRIRKSSLSLRRMKTLKSQLKFKKRNHLSHPSRLKFKFLFLRFLLPRCILCLVLEFLQFRSCRWFHNLGLNCYLLTAQLISLRHPRLSWTSTCRGLTSISKKNSSCLKLEKVSLWKQDLQSGRE